MTLEETLHAHGQRVTRPRQAVWDVLQASTRHRSAQELAAEVRARDPKVNVSSVYRTLALFAELGLVRESRLGPDASTWEAAHGDSTIHLVCRDCGAVQHHDARAVEQLRRDLHRDAAFDATHIDVRVSGTCAACTAR